MHRSRRKPRPPAAPPDQTEAPAEEALPDLGSLAPGFDAEAPLGIPGFGAPPPPEIALTEPEPPTPDPTRAHRPAPRPEIQTTTEPEAAPSAPAAGEAGAASASSAGAAASAAAAARNAGYEAEVRAAIARARVYPQRDRDRGIVGRVRITLTIARSGRLVDVRLLQSSGAPSLDAAGLAAARNARIPPAPADLPGERFSYEAALDFQLND